MNSQTFVSTMDAAFEFTNPSFHWGDYLVLVVLLVASGGIGIYYAIQQGKDNTMDIFLVGGRSMSVLPVSVSLFVSWMSAISFLSDPVEVYYYGGVYYFMMFGYVAALPVVAHVFAAFYHKMQMISVYEILCEKYSTQLGVYVLVVGLVAKAIFVGIALLAPSLAMSQMTGLSVTWAIIILGCICTFYTSLGGMKAVLWADTIQLFVMFGGLTACIVESTKYVGGIDRVWNIADETGRLNFDNISPNPLARATVWTFLFGGFFKVLGPYIAQQHNIQRFVALKTKKQVIKAVYLNIPLFMIFTTMYCMAGLVMYAYFHECDPLKAGRIAAVNQMMPLMVMETLKNYHGLPGLYLAALSSAALSTISSNMSGFTTLAMSDIVLPLYKKLKGRTMGASWQLFAAVVTSLVNGGLTIGMAFLVRRYKHMSIYTLTNVVFGGVGSPITGVYVLMVVFPWVTAWSAFKGSIVGLGVSLWFGLGAILDTPPSRDAKYISIVGCPLANSTSNAFTTPDMLAAMDDGSGWQLNELYRLAPPLYSGLGMLVTVLVSLLLEGLKRLFERICMRTSYAIDENEKEEPVEFAGITRQESYTEKDCNSYI